MPKLSMEDDFIGIYEQIQGFVGTGIIAQLRQDGADNYFHIINKTKG